MVAALGGKVKMPFGKHAGRDVHKLPKKYLLWLRNTVELRGDLLTAVQHALQGKAYTPPEKVKPQDVVDTDAILDTMLHNSWDAS